MKSSGTTIAFYRYFGALNGISGDDSIGIARMLFFESWMSVVRVLVSGVITYVLLIILLRITGKRTLSDMNIFDFVITVAIGTTFSSTMVSKDVTIIDGLAALILLTVMQLIVAWFTVRGGALGRFIKSTPRVMFLDGQFDDDALRHERVSREEVFQAMRSRGISILQQVEAVILETNGNFSIIRKSDRSGTTTLPGMKKEGT